MPYQERVELPVVVILCGGLGTRLQSVVSDVPKVLAPIAGKPYLVHLLEQIEAQGFRRVILALGYLSQLVVDYVTDNAWDERLDIAYSKESEPLGTAGALSLLLKSYPLNKMLVVNGDTILPLSIPEFIGHVLATTADSGIVCSVIDDASSYGTVDVDEQGFMVRFVEKQQAVAGSHLVNAGWYFLGAKLLSRIKKIERGSLESDVFGQLPPKQVVVYNTRQKFIDFGTPSNYHLACRTLTRTGE